MLNESISNIFRDIVLQSTKMVFAHVDRGIFTNIDKRNTNVIQYDRD